MARHRVGPRRTDSFRAYVLGTRIIGAVSILVLSGAVAWDLANDRFWSHHALFAGSELDRRRGDSGGAQRSARTAAAPALVGARRLLRQSQELLGRWADVMINSGAYAEIVDRHVELYSRLYWWGIVLDESEPLEEHLSWPSLSRVSPATQAVGPVENEWLRDNLVAIAQLADSLDRTSFELAMRIVPLDWWATQLPDRPGRG
jgi:hypothetical protein